MGLPGLERSLRLMLRIDVQDDPGHLAPVRIFGRRIKKADVGEQSLLVIAGQDRGIRCNVGNIGIKEWFKHGPPKFVEAQVAAFIR